MYPGADVFDGEPALWLDWTVAVAATDATGRLDVGNGRYEFEDGAVDLAGSGGLHLAGTGGQDRVGGMTGDRGPSLLTPWAMLLVVGAAAGTWVLGTPAARVRDKMALQLRERRVSSWLDMGDRMMKSYQYDRAAS